MYKKILFFLAMSTIAQASFKEHLYTAIDAHNFQLVQQLLNVRRAITASEKQEFMEHAFLAAESLRRVPVHKPIDYIHLFAGACFMWGSVRNYDANIYFKTHISEAAARLGFFATGVYALYLSGFGIEQRLRDAYAITEYIRSTPETVRIIQ